MRRFRWKAKTLPAKKWLQVLCKTGRLPAPVFIHILVRWLLSPPLPVALFHPIFCRQSFCLLEAPNNENTHFFPSSPRAKQVGRYSQRRFFAAELRAGKARTKERGVGPEGKGRRWPASRVRLGKVGHLRRAIALTSVRTKKLASSRPPTYDLLPRRQPLR